MEYGLREHDFSQREWYRLNPCCNGIWSQTEPSPQHHFTFSVLILVVMEYGLRQSGEIFVSVSQKGYVLILVVMEYGLRLYLR